MLEKSIEGKEREERESRKIEEGREVILYSGKILLRTRLVHVHRNG